MDVRYEVFGTVCGVFVWYAGIYEYVYVTTRERIHFENNEMNFNFKLKDVRDVAPVAVENAAHLHSFQGDFAVWLKSSILTKFERNYDDSLGNYDYQQNVAAKNAINNELRLVYVYDVTI